MFSASDLVGTAKSSVMDMAALSSKWDGLSPHLIASFYVVKKNGQTWDRAEGKDGLMTVKAPLMDANIDITLNWQSPFESAGPESKAPMLMAMLQAGVLQPMVDAIMSPSEGDQKGGGDAQKKSNEFLKQFEGRTGITKLNSTQVFSGMPPVKIQATALFRAWSDPASEVEAPMNQLIEWALPKALAKDSTILSNAAEAAQGKKGYIEALMPSEAPVTIAMKYKGRLYSPLVIESVGVPISSPIDSGGNFIEMALPLTLCSLTAIDREDWANGKTGAGGLLGGALSMIF